MSRRLLTVLACATTLVLGSCGGGGDGSDGDALDLALSYLPADATAVLVVSTDLGSEQYQRGGELLVSRLLGEGQEDADPGDVEELVRRAVDSSTELSYDVEIAPLLGNPVVFGTSDPEGLLFEGEPDGILALDTGDGEKLRDVIEGFPELEPAGEELGAELFSDESGLVWIAVDGDVLVASGERGDLLDALSRSAGSDHLTAAAFTEALGGLPEDAPVRASADLTRLLEVPELRPLADLPWVAALRSGGLALSFEESAILLDAVLNTDPNGLRPEHLPLPVKVETPGVIREAGKISGASANQSRTTAFLLEAVRVAYPDSDFVRDVARVERSLGIDFEQEVLLQFDGPSVSLLEPGGDFAARSTVRDPKRMARTLERLAPDLGRLVQDLQGLQSEGLAALFLVAPDAPIRPGVLPPGRITVSTVAGEPDLYRISGLSAGAPVGLPTPVPDEVFFGLIDEDFVVASSVREAKEIAAAKLGPPPRGVEGASVTVADLASFVEEVEDISEVDSALLGELAASAEASLSELRARVRLELD